MAGIKLDFDKSLKGLYDLGLSEGQVRMGHKNLQASLFVYFSFTFYSSAANFYILQRYEARHCQIGKKLSYLKSLSVAKRISFAF